MRFVYMMIFPALLAGILNCGSKPAAEITQRSAPSPPDWYTMPPLDADYLYSPATAIAGDIQSAIDQAKMQALAGLEGQLAGRIEAIRERFAHEVDLYTDREISARLTRVGDSALVTAIKQAQLSRQQLQVENGTYRAYVLMQLLVVEADRLLMQGIKGDQPLYVRLRSTETFRQLEQNIARYEKFERAGGRPR
jgi:hypothetical protein